MPIEACASFYSILTAAMVATSEPQPIFSPNAAASVSLPNMMSVYGIAAII